MYILLQTVRNCIENLEDVPFYDFYMNYISDVQDMSVNIEIGHIKNSHIVDICTLSKLVNTEHRKMGW